MRNRRLGLLLLTVVSHPCANAQVISATTEVPKDPWVAPPYVSKSIGEFALIREPLKERLVVARSLGGGRYQQLGAWVIDPEPETPNRDVILYNNGWIIAEVHSARMTVLFAWRTARFDRDPVTVSAPRFPQVSLAPNDLFAYYALLPEKEVVNSRTSRASAFYPPQLVFFLADGTAYRRSIDARAWSAQVSVNKIFFYTGTAPARTEQPFKTRDLKEFLKESAQLR